MEGSQQIGTVVSMSVQAGLLTIHPGSLSNWANVQASFWFMFGWSILNALLAVAFLRRPSVPPEKTPRIAAGPADSQTQTSMSESGAMSPGDRGVEHGGASAA